MHSIRPVLLVGPADFSRLRAVLRRHGLRGLVAGDVDAALRMLRHFRVDIILSTVNDPDHLARLAQARVPVVLVGTDPQLARDTKGVAFLDAKADVPRVAEFLRCLLSGEEPIPRTREVA